jgi:hypothetical protein
MTCKGSLFPVSGLLRRSDSRRRKPKNVSVFPVNRDCVNQTVSVLPMLPVVFADQVRLQN